MTLGARENYLSLILVLCNNEFINKHNQKKKNISTTSLLNWQNVFHRRPKIKKKKKKMWKYKNLYGYDCIKNDDKM